MSISPRLSVEGQQAAANAQPPEQVGMLSKREATVLHNACVKKLNKTVENISSLIGIAAIVAGIAVAYFVGIVNGGLLFGFVTAYLLNNTLASLGDIFRNRDLEHAVEALESEGFKQHLQRNHFSPSVDTIVTIWKGYNTFNTTQAKRLNQPALA